MRPGLLLRSTLLVLVVGVSSGAPGPLYQAWRFSKHGIGRGRLEAPLVVLACILAALGLAVALTKRLPIASAWSGGRPVGKTLLGCWAQAFALNSVVLWTAFLCYLARGSEGIALTAFVATLEAVPPILVNLGAGVAIPMAARALRPSDTRGRSS